MTETRTHRRVVRNRKKRSVPLSKLRASDVVKTVVDHPRRLEELLLMLEEKEAGARGRAAATLARLSESHPSRLLRATPRLKDSLVDDSAYVRWYLVYALGRIGLRFPSQSDGFLKELVTRLEDSNRVVRVLASKALCQIAECKPPVIEELFQSLKKDLPPAVARSLRKSKTKSSSGR